LLNRNTLDDFLILLKDVYYLNAEHSNKTTAVYFPNMNEVDSVFVDKDRPAWYDPVFTKVFTQLKDK
jgi:hypothetical protein